MGVDGALGLRSGEVGAAEACPAATGAEGSADCFVGKVGEVD